MRHPDAMVDVLVAGEKKDVDQAEQVITEIIRFGFSSLTHPGIVRETFEVDSFQKPFLIGRKGVEINKIRDTFHLRDIDVPQEAGTCSLIGSKDQVAQAQKYIQKMLSGVEDKVQ